MPDNMEAIMLIPPSHRLPAAGETTASSIEQTTTDAAHKRLARFVWRHKGRIIVVAITAGLIGCGCYGLQKNWERVHALDIAAITRVEQSRSGLSSLRLEATQLATDTTEELVADPTVLTTLQRELDASGDALAVEAKAEGGNTWFDWAGIERRANANEAIADANSVAFDELSDTMSDVRASVALKERMNAAAELTELRDAAQTAYDSYRNQVMESSKASALADAIATANDRLATDPADASSPEFYSEVTSSLTDAKSAFDDSHDAWAKRQRELAAARASSGGGSSSSVGGAWAPSFVTAYGSQSAIDAGNLVEVAHNYFAAHNYTSFGRMIAAHPQYIIIRGQRYRYAGTINVDKYNTLMSYATGWVGAGNVGTQTCNWDGATTQVNRYVPA